MDKIYKSKEPPVAVEVLMIEGAIPSYPPLVKQGIRTPQKKPIPRPGKINWNFSTETELHLLSTLGIIALGGYWSETAVSFERDT